MAPNLRNLIKNAISFGARRGVEGGVVIQVNVNPAEMYPHAVRAATGKTLVSLLKMEARLSKLGFGEDASGLPRREPVKDGMSRNIEVDPDASDERVMSTIQQLNLLLQKYESLSGQRGNQEWCQDEEFEALEGIIRGMAMQLRGFVAMMNSGHF